VTDRNRQTATERLLDRFARDGDCYRQYTDDVEAALDDDGVVTAAFAAWRSFFRQSHGDAFVGLPDDVTTEAVFADALYYDFLIERLLARAEGVLAVDVSNREPGSNTGALDVDFVAVHDIVAGDGLAEQVDESIAAVEVTALDGSVLRRLFESVVTQSVRLALGEYYTPRGVADLAVDDLAIDDLAAETFLDPGCGSGVFLSTVVERKRAGYAAADDAPTPAQRVAEITNSVYGIDLNPIAVRSARLGYLLSLAPLLDDTAISAVELPVFLTDALGLTRDDDLRYGGETLTPTVDHLVGNPPWLTWSALPDDVRTAWRDGPADRLDLVVHRGADAKLGHANDDVSVPFVLACMDRYLDGGDAAFVLKRGIVKGPAGRRLREQRLNGAPVAVDHVHDFTDLRPFGDARAGAAVYSLSVGSKPTTPIPVTAWSRDGMMPEFGTLDRLRETLACEETGFVPVDEDDPASSWLRRDAERRALGECTHEIRHGVKDDARDVFELDPERVDDLEPDRVFPYLKSRHVVKFGLFGHDYRLVPLDNANEDNEAWLEAECPRTYAYLDANREALAARSSSWLDNGTFYNVFGLGEYTWAEYKVVWCRLGYKPHFVVVSTVEDDLLGEQPIVPGDHCMFIGTDDGSEAHFLCALLNSSIYQRTLDDVSSGGKSSLSKSVVSRLELPRLDDVDARAADRLADLSRAAHGIVPEHTDVSKRAYNRTTIDDLVPIRAEIDALVEELLARRE
jgi:SAM-dependent methyltransferase